MGGIRILSTAWEPALLERVRHNSEPSPIRFVTGLCERFKKD